MHVLTTRGGELVVLTGPIRSDHTCTGCGGWAALDGACLFDVATVADRDDVDLPDIVAAARRYLERTGWGELGADFVAELAADMAANAADYPLEPGCEPP